MIDGPWIETFHNDSCCKRRTVHPREIYTWLIYYSGPDPYFGRANYLHSIAII